MLAQAKDKQVYDALVKAELTAYLHEHPDEFDVIVASDALVYFGDLDQVLTAAGEALRPQGFLVFTLERAANGGSEEGYRLQVHGRYAHRQAYVEQALAALGLRPEIVHADLRTESGVPVAGLVIRAIKGPDRLRTAPGGQ